MSILKRIRDIGTNERRMDPFPVEIDINHVEISDKQPRGFGYEQKHRMDLVVSIEYWASNVNENAIREQSLKTLINTLYMDVNPHIESLKYYMINKDIDKAMAVLSKIENSTYSRDINYE